jgi:hypothetical protein
MPNWKKLIVSGSDANLNSLTVTTSGSFYDDLTISGSNSSLIIKGDGTKFARITHDGSGLVIDGGVQNQYISIGSPTWNYPNGVKVYGDLEQTGSAGGTATFEGPTQSTLNLKTTTNSKNNYIVGTTAGNLSLRPNGSESLMLLANGNVGIGTTSPVNKLQVNYTPYGISSLTATAGTAASNWNRNAGLMITGASVSNALALGASGTANDRKAWIQVGHPDTAANSLGSLALNPLGGNVGIGTTSPTTKLNIANDSSGAILSFKRNNSTTAGAKGGLTWVDSSNYYVAGISVAGDGTTDNSGELVFRTSTGEASNADLGYQLPERMRIDSAGNIGIGTTSPGRKLHINNSSGVGEAVISGTTGATLYFRPNASYSLAGNFGIFTTGLSSGTYESTMDFKGYYNGVTTPLTIKGSGNVGIGTSSPSAKLEINGGTGVSTSGAFILRQTGNGSADGMSITSGHATSTRLWKDSNGIFNIGSSGNANAFQQDIAGNITIEGDIDADDITINDWGSVSASLASISDAGGVNGSGATNRVALWSDSDTLTSDAGLTFANSTLNVASTTNDYVAKFSHTTATGYAPGSILLQAGQGASRGQGLFHYNTEADDSWFTGVPYNVNSTKWIVAHKPDTTFNPDVAQTSHAIFTLDSSNDLATFTGDIKSTSGVLALGADVTLFRDGANILRTDDTFHANSNIHVGGAGKIYDRANNANYIELADTVNISTDTSISGNLEVNSNISTPNNTSLRLQPSGSSGWIFLGSPTDGTKIYHYSRGDNGENTVYDFDAGYYKISTTATSGFNLTQDTKVSGDLTVTGTITAQEFHTEFVSASIMYESGSTKFGDTSDDNHDFTGSLEVRMTDSAGDGKRSFIASGSSGVRLQRKGDGNGWAMEYGFNANDGTNLRGFGGYGTGNSYLQYHYIGGTFNNPNVTVLAGGNVGIGTTSPSDKLDVFGDLRVSYDASNFFTIEPISNGNAYFKPSGGSIHVAKTTKNNQIFLYDYTGSSTRWGEYDASSINLKTSTNTTGILLNTDGNSYINTGNVGIGTTSPTGLLEIMSTTNPVLRISNGGGTSPNPKIELFRQGGVLGNVQYDVANKVMILENQSALGGFDFNIASSTKMAIDLNGNVGIGTATPSQKLHVLGNLELQSGFQIGSEDGNYYQRILTEDDSSENANTFQFQVRKGVGTSYGSLLTLIQSGKVKLPAYGSGTFTGTVASTLGVDSSGNIIEFSGGGGGSVSSITSGADTRVAYFNGTDSLEGSANFTWDDSKLDVGGNILISDTGNDKYFGSNVNLILNADADGNSGASARNIIFQNRGSEKMRIDSAGNVGIGTTSPAYKLDVAGSLRGQGLNSYRYSTATNDIDNFSYLTKTMAMPPNGYLWHDLFAFGYNYTVVQEQYDGTTWSSASTQDALFIQKQDQSIEVISSSNTGVRWTFNNVSWSLAQYLNLAFTHVSSDISKDVLVESSTDNSTWTTRFTNTAAAGIGTKTCALSAYNGDAYLRITITKGSVSTNVVRMSQIRLMTSRAGDQGQGMEQQYPYSWNSDRDIGIGTTSPAAKLHVNSSSATAVQRIQGATNSALEFYNSSTKTGAILVNSTQFLIAADNSNYLSINTGGSERMRISSAGNVGIGTISPTSLLEVSQNLSAASTIDYPYTISSRDDGNTINQLGGEGIGIKFKIAGNAATTPGDSLVGASIAAIRESASDADSSTGLGFFVTQNDETLDEALRIDHDGNVGIGTSSPGSKLHVEGSIQLGSGAATDDNSLIIYGNNGTASRYIKLLHHNASSSSIQTNNTYLSISAANYIVLSNNTLIYQGVKFSNDKKLEYQESDNSYFTVLNVNSSNLIQIGSVTSTSTGGDTAFYHTGVEKMRIISTGHVGIGTSNPLYKLDVDGDIQNNGVLRRGGNVYIKNTGSETMIGPGGSGIITFHNSATMTAGDEKVRIDASGNLLLNNTSAGARLDIREDTNYAIRAEDATGHYFRVNTGGDVDMRGDLVVQGTITAQQFHSEFVSASIIYESGSTKFGDTSDDIHSFSGSLQVTGSGAHYFTDGKLVVGSTTSNYKFGVTGGHMGVSNGGNVYVGGFGADSVIGYMGNSSGVFTLRSDGNRDVSIGSGTVNSSIFIEGSNGKVGIGTDSPATALDVHGTSDTYLTIRNSGGGYKAGIRMYGGSSGISHIWHDDTETNPPGIHFGTSADTATTPTTQMYIKGSNGNVGIGTTSPVAALNIGNNGNIRIDGNSSGGGIYASSNGSNNTFSLTRQDGVNVGDLSISGYSGVGITGGRNSSPATSGYSFYVKSDGNVGIGTTAPKQLFHVHGGSTAGSVTKAVIGGTGGNGESHLYLAEHFSGDNVSYGFSFVTDGNSSNNLLIKRHSNSTSGVTVLTINRDNSDASFSGALQVGSNLDVNGTSLTLSSAAISYQNNNDVDTGIETIATVVKANHDAAFFDYVVKNGTNLRAGTVMAVHDGTNVEFTDNSTKDIGDTSGVTFSVDISGTDLRLRATTTSDNWIIKTLVKSI